MLLLQGGEEDYTKADLSAIFEFLDDSGDESMDEGQAASTDSLNLELHPLKKQDSVLISVLPPHEPQPGIKHVSCDIVLVIDVSGSMRFEAPLPDTQGQEVKETSGLSVLDLTKHAAKTVLESLNQGDRLALVAFSHDARVIQDLTPMTEEAKKKAAARIESLRDEASTNLWAGITTGLKVFEDAPEIGNVQGLFVLTDGMPNHMCPRRGYIPTLVPHLAEMSSRRSCMPSIHTFGFGYSIKSHLMQSIAEVGDGNYAFIPDAGMIGTVFVHAVANLQSTYATSAVLEIQASNPSAALKSTSGLMTTQSEPNRLSIKLGNIQYGQSRDIVIPYEDMDPTSTLTATTTYKLPNGTNKTITKTVNLTNKTTLPASTTNYHIHRLELCTFLSSLFPTQPNGDRLKPSEPTSEIRNELSYLTPSIQSSLVSNPSDPNLLSLLHDLVGPSGEPTGQIHQSLQTHPQNYWKKWGHHYLPSLLHAHLRQTCNSFKDPGPLRYGLSSPLFIQCRDTLDALFEKLPAPRPSIPVRYGDREHSDVTMDRYHRSSNPCFLGDCEVEVMGGEKVRVEGLRRGVKIWNPLVRKEVEVVKVVETTNLEKGGRIYRVGGEGGLWVTGYHPILYDNRWVFPRDVAECVRELEEGEGVYSILLEQSENIDAHAMVVGGVVCVTLGHGLVAGNESDHEDVRVHPFFGDYEAVERSLEGLRVDENGHCVCGGIWRDEGTGLACGFLSERSRKESGTMDRCARSVQVVRLQDEELSVLVSV